MRACEVVAGLAAEVGMTTRKDLSRVELQVLDAVVAGASTPAEIKAVVTDATPTYVDRVLVRLVEQGWLEVKKEPAIYRALRRIEIVDVEAS
jgi:hypothetical protein